MADQTDVRRIALSLPNTVEEKKHFAFSVRNGNKKKGFAWVWMERIRPNTPRIPQPHVLAVRVANQIEKERLLASEPKIFFTEPHYNGFPAILIRLRIITINKLEEHVINGWRCQAPRAFVKRYETTHRIAPPKPSG